jgi:hypothetical protein
MTTARSAPLPSPPPPHSMNWDDYRARPIRRPNLAFLAGASVRAAKRRRRDRTMARLTMRTVGGMRGLGLDQSHRLTLDGTTRLPSTYYTGFNEQWSNAAASLGVILISSAESSSCIGWVEKGYFHPTPPLDLALALASKSGCAQCAPVP